jgi:excisionase family DNA binding protein
MDAPMKDTENKEETPSLPRLAYTMQETADILGVSYITVHRLLKRGLLKCSSAVRHKLIPASEIERFLKDTLE